MSPLADDSKLILRAVFGEKWPEAWVSWKSNMRGKRVKHLKPGDLPDTDDCYFCVALMKPGAVTRSLANAKSVHAVVIDDVGTKIDGEAFMMLAPEPTWLVETSSGNFQAGYALTDGVDVDEYKAFRGRMKGHAVWGHSDGASAVHLFRLPQGTNTKTGWRVA